ncbi:MAG: MFS transporter [Xanthobacteraceae bacterium]|jgi:MFS transporter, DHA1 family, inner membrane transport protein
MAYFRNNTVNLLNLHYGLHSLALSGSGAFFAVFLLKSGVPAPAVLAAIAFILVGRLLIRPSVLVLAKRVGLKPLVIVGTIATGLQYPLLAEVHGIGAALFVLCAVSAVADTFYWTTYHAYFASLGDAEHRGHQVGAREAIAAVVGIVGPLATGWALTTLGPRVAFDATAVVLVLAALPIFWTPSVAVPFAVSGALKAAIPGALLFAADAWIAAGYVFVWQIALFLSLGESFSAFGGAMALAALVGAVGGMFLGRHIDAGHGTRAAWIVLAALALTTILRAASYGNAPFAVVANACGALVTCLYLPALGTAVYNQAKRSPCALRFHIAAEAGWDIGGASALLIAAGLLALGVPVGAVILLSLLGTGGSFLLLRQYFAVIKPTATPPARPVLARQAGP